MEANLEVAPRRGELNIPRHNKILCDAIERLDIAQRSGSLRGTRILGLPRLVHGQDADRGEGGCALVLGVHDGVVGGS